MKQTIDIIHPYFKTGGISGYIAIHIPRRIVKRFDINRQTHFVVYDEDGRLVLAQETEERHVLLGSEPSKA